MRMPSLVVAVLLVLAPAAARAGSQSDAKDFATEAKLFYRIVACAGNDPVDPAIAKVVDAHCKWLAKEGGDYRKHFLDPATAFFAKVRPSGLPTTVVYPFGGGDLISALVTYPDATDITTLSLEHAGDPTRLASATAKDLKKAFATLHTVAHGLLVNGDFESDKLKLLERGPLPGQLSLFVIAASMMGYQPTHLRYFKVGDDGTLDYYTQADIDALAKTHAKKKSGTWIDPDWSEAFSNMELELAKVDDPKRTIVDRHIAANLDDKHFKGSGVEKYLDAKGKVAMMTKAASYLIWETNFSEIADFIGAHLVWMASDSTGIPPRIAKAHNLEQETYGTFTHAMFRVPHGDEDAFARLWKKQPKRKLAFRYGYRDGDKHAHLVITRPAGGTP